MASMKRSGGSTLALTAQLLLLASFLPHPSTSAAPPSEVKRYYQVAVEGVVYCKSCKQMPGYNKHIDASPLPGAIVKLSCNLKAKPTTARDDYETTAKTDKNGYFYMEASPKALNSGMAGLCRVFLVSSPVAGCAKPTDINGGVSGARLTYERIITRGKRYNYALYTSGLLLFGPSTGKSCPKNAQY